MKRALPPGARCRECRSYALNLWKEGIATDLCDVCYWRGQAAQVDDLKARLRAVRRLTSEVAWERVRLLDEAVRVALAFMRPFEADSRQRLERARVETAADLVFVLRRTLDETKAEPWRGHPGGKRQ